LRPGMVWRKGWKRSTWRFAFCPAVMQTHSPPVAPDRTVNRIDAAFARLRAAGEKGFMAYLAAGDPDLARTAELVLALERAGVDFVELGVPFSDPLADGVVNQLAAARALRAGTTVAGVLGCVRGLRERTGLPLVLYTYMNPVYAYGFARFLRDATAAGVDGLLLLDLPPDEAERNEELRRAPAEGAATPGATPKLIRLIAPNTPAERLRVIAASGEGFLYYVSREGVTGERQELSASIAEQVAAIRQVTDLPVAVGFGISTPAQAAAVADSADAVVVGSAIVRQIGEHGGAADLPARIEAFVRPLVAAVKKNPRQRPA
jgi:tryptophan synthase alpha chain